MVYADYEYYVNTYLGTSISEDDFSRLALRASAFLDYYTQGKAQNNADLDALKMACCAIAEQYQIIEASQSVAQKSLAYSMTSEGAEVSSESVGSWSKSYQSGGNSAAAAASAMAAYRQAMSDIAKQYLFGTGLLYRGGRCPKCQCSRTL